MESKNIDFFDMDFSDLFLKKHGKDSFNNIVSLINSENTEEYDNNYIPIIFKVAFLDFFGLKIHEINTLIEHYYPVQNINIDKLLSVHSKSIQLIEDYLKNTMENEK